MIVIEDLHKTFRGHHVLSGVNLAVQPAATTVIIGRSGGGKSVLLKHLIGLMRPDRGRILVDGVELTRADGRQLAALRRRFGVLFQDAALFDSMTVLDNVAFPLLEHTRLARRQARELARQRLADVGLGTMGDKMPSQLSGGMRKRVGLARALALDPEILFFDEPTTGLDPIMSGAIERLIIRTQASLQLTSVIISHDLPSVFRMAHTVAMLHDGRIIAAGTPLEIQASPEPVVQDFLAGRAPEEVAMTDPSEA
ncbi:MAG: ABC transporter ATP-binding protein [Thermodesulfobacteriota bacterium]